jgi:RNA polymerase sigma factor (sigma-70 family)
MVYIIAPKDMNRKEFDTFYVFNNRRMFSIAMKFTNNREDAKDLVQETYLRCAVYAMKNRIENFETFSHSVMRSLYLNKIRPNTLRYVLIDFSQEVPEVTKLISRMDVVVGDFFSSLWMQKLRKEVMAFVISNE